MRKPEIKMEAQCSKRSRNRRGEQQRAGENGREQERMTKKSSDVWIDYIMWPPSLKRGKGCSCLHTSPSDTCASILHIVFLFRHPTNRQSAYSWGVVALANLGIYCRTRCSGPANFDCVEPNLRQAAWGPFAV